MTNTQTPPVGELIADPTAHFSSPMDVLDTALPRDVKQRILESWELDERRLAESTNENMSGGERSHLGAIAEARRRLEASQDEPS